MTARLADALAALEAAYPPALAQGWDAVGLVCGDPADKVSSVLVAVDPVVETVEAFDLGAQLLVTHHPLLLRGARGRRGHPEGRAGAPADPPRCGAVHRAHQRRRRRPRRLRRAGRRARPGGGGPAGPEARSTRSFIPVDHGGARRAGRRGAGRSATATARSPPRAPASSPLAGAHLTIGEVGKLERVAETRLEMVLPRGRRAAVVAAVPRTPTRSPPSTSSSSPTCRRRAGWAGSAPCPSPSRCTPSPTVSPPPCRRPLGRAAAGDPDRPIRRSRCGRGGLRAGRGRRGRRRRLRRGPAAPPGVGEPGWRAVRRWSTSPTGRRSALVRAGGRRPARGAGR